MSQIRTKEECAEEALKYNTKTEFQKNNSTVYSYAHKYHWINDICEHMVNLKKPDGYWTKEKCTEEALKYKSRSEFKRNSSAAYTISLENGWILLNKLRGGGLGASKMHEN